MAEHERTRHGRRRFLEGLARGLALVGLGALGAGLLAARPGGLADQTCGHEGGCRRCPRLARCGLPQGMSARRVIGSP